MATKTTKKRNLFYLSRDFESSKRSFIEYLRTYFGDFVQDFNESSINMVLTEVVSATGDMLNFYIDRRFQEVFTESARELTNVFKSGKQLGFRPFGKTAAVGKVDCYLKVPAAKTNLEIVPDMKYAGTIKKSAKCKSKSGQTYEIVEDVDFSTVDILNPLFVQVGDVNPQTQEPTSFILKKQDVDVRAGETKTTTVSVGNYEAFKKITLTDEDVLEIISVVDSDGNIWREVDYLAQDTVFSSVTNAGNNKSDVPYILKLIDAPYRFVSEYDAVTNKTSLIFGSGDAQQFDGELIPDLGDLSLPLYGKDSFSGFFLDPQNFLKTRTLGLAPSNTTLTIKYRFGGGSATNVGTRQIDTVVERVFDVGNSSLDVNVVADVANSFEVLNFSPVEGGKEVLSIDEYKQLIPAIHAAQDRVVNVADFAARSLSMPAKFGSVFRVGVKTNPLNNRSVELIVLSRNAAGNVTTAPAELKNNLKNYLSKYRMLTDAIEILDGEIINLGLNLEVLTTTEVNKSEVVVECIEALKHHFDIRFWQINQPINYTDIIALLADIPGVLSVVKLDFVNLVGNVEGRSYSLTTHNISANIKNNILYCKNNAIFEIKNLSKDIKVVAK